MGVSLSITSCSISGLFQASQAEEGHPEPPDLSLIPCWPPAQQSLGKQCAPADPA